MSTAQLALIGPDSLVHPLAVMSAHVGRNDRLIASVARLYVPDGATVIDVTYGKGIFWRRTDTTRFRLVGADLHSTDASIRADFRAMPFADAAADVIVLDPPYVQRPEANRFIDLRYRNSQTTEGMTYAGMLDMYSAGLLEAARVLRPGGTCWVKCQDATENRCQRWTVIDMVGCAAAAALTPRDLFVLTNPWPPGGHRVARQAHARRNHSYLWIFRKPRRSS